MVGRDRALSIVTKAVEFSEADQTEAVVRVTDAYLTRFSSNYIHQNVGEHNVQLSVRVALGKRLGSASTNAVDEQGIRECVQRALRIARVQEENPDFASFPAPEPIPEVGGYFEETAECTPDRRAEGVARIIDAASSRGLQAAGAFSTAAAELAVANSLGVRAYHRWTTAALNTVIMSDEGSGWAAALAGQVGDIDPQAVASRAIDKCLRSAHPAALEPGEYEVVLEPAAVATLMGFLARLGFSALAVQEGRSFLCGKIGQRIVDERITMWDDATDPAGIPMAFDFEGVPKRRLSLLRRGVAENVVHDSFTAGREGKKSTGHAIPGGFGEPMPTHLFVASGEATLEEMIASTRRGILVTRFHYVNPVHPVKTIITGMTRDGTFLIENGRVTRPVKNFRFTESILNALNQVELVGKDRELHGGRLGGIMVPALKLRRFHFTGVTEF